MSDIFNSFPVMKVGNFILRELDKKDVKAFYSYISDPMVNRYIADEDTPKNLPQAEEELQYWADLYKYRRSIYWGIVKKDNDTLIGTCGFNIWSRNHARTEISYDLARNEWGKGIMTTCLRAVCDFAFSRMQVNRIQATVAVDNIGSIKVLEKLGFKQEGILREYGILHGKKKDFYMYGLLSNDIVF